MSSAAAGWLQFALLVAALAVCYVPLGNYIARVFTAKDHWRVERGIYKLCGIDPEADMRWSVYVRSVLAFSLVSVLLLYLLERTQHWLFLSVGMSNVAPATAFNTAASFTTNTNWQNYAGESTMSYLTQMSGLAVQNYLAADLRAEGATVVLTRTSNTGVGPCVTERAGIGNAARANVAVSVHADGGPSWGRGFALLAPVADGPNNAIIGASFVLADDLRAAFAAGTGEPVSNYDGIDGIQPRDNLAGTNLSTVPKVFIECANMRNAADAALVTSPAWQAAAARAIAAGLTAFLRTG